MANARRSFATTATAHAAALDTGASGLVEHNWGLVTHPFRLTPDPELVYESTDFQEALARLLYDIVEFGGGLSVVTGETGVGKTTLTRALAEALPHDHYRVALVVNPLMPVAQLLATLLEELGVAHPPRRKAGLLDEFAARVAALDGEGIEPVVVVDEAQTLKRQHLQELRLLINFEARDRKLFHLVLAGQPELTRKIHRIAALDERVTMRCRLGALSPAEGVRYIHHRLHMAGATDTVFAPKAATHLVRLAGGIPRRMNLLASAALVAGAAAGVRRITVRIVDRAHDQLVAEAKR
jgi:general secretion pathway protein A